MYSLFTSQACVLDTNDGSGTARKGSAVSYFRSMPEPFDDVQDTLPDFSLVSRRLRNLRSPESGDVSFDNGSSPVLSSMHYDDLSTDSGVSGVSRDISLDAPDFSHIPDGLVYTDETALAPKASSPRSFARKLFKNSPASPGDDPESPSGYQPVKRPIAVQQSRTSVKRRNTGSPTRVRNVSGDPSCQPGSPEEFSAEAMTGDYGGPCCLPVMLRGSQPDLNCISSRTLGRLLNGVYADVVRSYRIIDCRYPYEFDAGHILNAVNIWQQDAVIREFIHSDEHRATDSDSGRHVVIFHCEFSSERGPKMSRFLRNADRKKNMDRYPMLYHPEMYLLHGGYKDFFHRLPELCRPQIYKPMMHPNHVTEVRHFRVKSKSWAGSKCKARQ